MREVVSQFSHTCWKALGATGLILACLESFCAFGGTPSPVMGHETNDTAKARFTFSSQVIQQDDGRYIREHSVKNDHPEQPLTFRWEMVDLFRENMSPGDSAITRTSPSSALPMEIPSKIKYGAILSYTRPAEMYANPEYEQGLSSTEFEERNKEKIIARISVTSTLDREARTSKISFKAKPNTRLVIPAPLSVTIGDYMPKMNTQWKLEHFSELSEAAKSWLGGAPSEGPSAIVLAVPPSGEELSFHVSGKDFTPTKIPIVGILPEGAGYAGITIKVYLPKTVLNFAVK